MVRWSEFGGCGISLHITLSLSLQSSFAWSHFLLLHARRELLEHHVTNSERNVCLDCNLSQILRKGGRQEHPEQRRAQGPAHRRARRHIWENPRPGSSGQDI